MERRPISSYSLSERDAWWWSCSLTCANPFTCFPVCIGDLSTAPATMSIGLPRFSVLLFFLWATCFRRFTSPTRGIDGDKSPQQLSTPILAKKSTNLRYRLVTTPISIFGFDAVCTCLAFVTVAQAGHG